jgi:hypothetical protein
MEPVAVGDALDRDDVAPGGFLRQDQADIHHNAIHQNRTRAAVAVAATFLGACQAQPIPQQFKQRVARIGEHGVLLTIDGARDHRFHAIASSICNRR